MNTNSTSTSVNRMFFNPLLTSTRTILSNKPVKGIALLPAIAEWMFFGYILGYLPTQLLVVMGPADLALKIGAFSAVITLGVVISLRASVVRKNCDIMLLLLPLWILLSVAIFVKLLNLPSDLYGYPL